MLIDKGWPAPAQCDSELDIPHVSEVSDEAMTLFLLNPPFSFSSSGLRMIK